jgi:transcriptional regulator with XRE-family HTH domain
MARSRRSRRERRAIEDVIAERVCALRSERGLSTRALAREAGCSATTVAAIERSSPATVQTLDAVAAALGVPLGELVSDSTVRGPVAERALYRLMKKLREKDEKFLRAIERVVEAMESPPPPR